MRTSGLLSLKVEKGCFQSNQQDTMAHCGLYRLRWCRPDATSADVGACGAREESVSLGRQGPRGAQTGTN